MNRSSKNNEWISNQSLLEDVSFAKRLREIWRDLQDQRVGNMNSYPRFNCLKNRSFMGIQRTLMSWPAPIGFGVAGHACLQQPAVLFGYL